MTKRNTILPALAAALAACLALVSCEKSRQVSEETPSCDTPWQFALTRAGETVHTDRVETYRATLLHNGTRQVMADGSYCGYYLDNNEPGWPYEMGWLYPCRTDNAGVALDNSGSPVSTTDPAYWFSHIDKDSKYGLRGPGDLRERFGLDYSPLYALVFSSPAVRMERFTPDGGTPPTGTAVNNPMNYHWGFRIERDSEFAVSPSINGLSLAATYLNGQYVFNVNPVLKDRHAKLTVKVACGAVSEAFVHAVYFTNILSTAFYMPMMETYEKGTADWEFDGGVTNPLTNYYTHNSYPANNGDPTGTGDKLETPNNSPIHLVRKTGQTPDFIAENEWQNFTTADEWVKGSNNKSLLTAIRDFRLLSMDYSARTGDAYTYEEFIPKVVVLSGEDGDVKTTIRIAENLEPMKAYTLYVWVSSAYVHAVLTVSPWEENSLDVSFNDDKVKDFTPLVISSWTTVQQNPYDDGLIENPQNPQE